MNAFNPRRPKVIVRQLLAAISLALLSTSAFAVVLAESTFEPLGDLDGWTGVECDNPGLCSVPLLGPPVVGEGPLDGMEFFHATDDPQPFESGAGYLEIVDPGSLTTGLYNAPSEFTSAIAPGTVLELDFKVNGVGGSYDNGATGGLVPLLYIENADDAGTGVVYLLPETEIPIGVWLEFAIPIVPNDDPAAGPGDWFAFGGGSLTAVADGGMGFEDTFLGSDTILRIWGELTKDAADEDGTQLDNVRLTAVPVPAALPLLLSALGVFGLWRRKV